MTYSIKIVDDEHKPIGELMTATAEQVITFINKGFIVINKMTGEEMTIDSVTCSMGVSDGLTVIG